MKISQSRPLTIIAASALSLTACLNSQFAQFAQIDRGEDAEASAAYVLQGIGTPEACLPSDSQCLENKFYGECDPGASGVIASCLQWLAELETLPEPRHTQIELLRASTYYRLSELRGRTENPNFPDLYGQGDALLSAEHYLQRVKAIGQMVHDTQPDNTQAMRVLALTADDAREKLAWNRQIVTTESPSTLTCRLLHGALYQAAGTDEDRTRADSEAAGCYMTSYRATETQRSNWNAASAAVDNLARAGQTLRKNRFLAEVERDLGATQKLRKLRNIERLTAREAESTLQDLCSRSTRKMLGADDCDKALQQALASVSQLPVEEAVPYANATMAGIRERLQPAEVIVTSDESELIRTQLAPLVREALIAQDIESGQIYATYSILVMHDSEASLSALERAIELEPADGSIRHQLGMLYERLGFTEQAIEQYELAILNNPEFTRRGLLTVIERLKTSTGTNN